MVSKAYATDGGSSIQSYCAPGKTKLDNTPANYAKQKKTTLPQAMQEVTLKKANANYAISVIPKATANDAKSIVYKATANDKYNIQSYCKRCQQFEIESFCK